ncbi:MAG: tripartite tricarboxylate transporter permease [Candidatus Aminicenantes bacterium]|nr:tripartite tricarboxylate transporter permease [Candidatus Aminicenantes bacterium]
MILLIIGGMFVGILFGALPGLTNVMGIVLFLPFTFDMSLYEALVLLGAIYGGAVYGGAITAILINIPGAPANIATCFDGFPMALKGEAKEALSLAVLCSTIGGLLGVFALIFLSPQLAAIALKFGPPEKFWVMVFSLSVIVALSAESLAKGIIAGSFGLLLATVGMPPDVGTEPRFLFGTYQFVGGINVVCALIGYFAFSQCIDMFSTNLNIATTITNIDNKVGFSKIFRILMAKYKFNLLRSSILGVIIGIIPGAGGSVASIISYNEAKRFARNPDDYGKGEWGGVIASEAANNATEGGALIPMLSLGIPGSPAAAAFVAALIIHGVWPGPALFIQHLDTVYTLFAGLIIAQIVMLFMGHFGAQYFSLALKIPKNLLGMMVIILCLFGSYTVSNNMAGVYVMFATGILGFIGQKVGIPPAPVVLGLILSKETEAALMQSIEIGQAKGSLLFYLFSSPLCVLLFALVLASFTYVIYRRLKKSKS